MNKQTTNNSKNFLDINLQAIFLKKQRPLIFTSQNHQLHHKKIFDDIYNSSIFNQFSFLISNQYQPCDCFNSIIECPKLKDIIKDNQKQKAKSIFEKFKLFFQSSAQKKQVKLINLPFKYEVIQPHYQNLMHVLKVQNPLVLLQILKHLKIDYLAFWIYGLYIKQFPGLDRLLKNIHKISSEFNLNIDVENLIFDQKFKQSYQSKLLSIFPIYFSSIVNIVCRSLEIQKIIQKLIICYFIKGRKRQQIQIIKTALQM